MALAVPGGGAGHPPMVDNHSCGVTKGSRFIPISFRFRFTIPFRANRHDFGFYFFFAQSGRNAGFATIAVTWGYLSASMAHRDCGSAQNALDTATNFVRILPGEGSNG
jgi:hypothetical protein